MWAVSAAEAWDDRFRRVGEIGDSEDAYGLAKCAESFGDPELGLAYFRQAVHAAASPAEQARRRASLGAALSRHGQLDEALAVLMQSIQLDPSVDTNRASFTALLALRHQRGELKKARALADAMQPTLHDDPRFLRVCDEVLGDSGRGRRVRVPLPDPPEAFETVRAREEAYREQARHAAQIRAELVRKADLLERHLLALAQPAA